MSLLSRAISGYAEIRADVSGTPAPWDDYWYGPIGSGSASGYRVSADSIKRLATVVSCVNKIAKTMAMLPFKMYEDKGEDGKKIATGHPIYDLLYSEPNQQQTAFEFRQMLQGHVELRGNAYAEILAGPRGFVDQLIPLHPDRVQPERLTNGHIRYRYNDPLTNTVRYLLEHEVFHLRNFIDDGLMGQSTIAMGADTFGVALAAQDYYARFLRNDARPGLVLKGGVFKTNQDRDAFRESWQRSQTGADRHKTAVLPPGMDVTPIGVTGKDAELLEARKYSREEICSLFDVPPHMIGVVEKTASYASVEQFNIFFAVFCILPRAIMWEQAVQRSLVLSPRFYPKFSMGALLRGDTAARFNAYKIAIENGWMNQDEVRIAEDMNPIAGGVGQHYWRPLNWARLEDVHTSVQPKGKGAGDQGTVDTEDPNAAPGQQAHRGRLQLLAAMAAQPYVRKEINTVRRMSQKSKTTDEFRSALDGFYAEHETFLIDRLHIPVAEARRYCDTNKNFLMALPNPLQLNGELDAMETYGTQLLGRQAAEVVQ